MIPDGVLSTRHTLQAQQCPWHRARTIARRAGDAAVGRPQGLGNPLREREACAAGWAAGTGRWRGGGASHLQHNNQMRKCLVCMARAGPRLAPEHGASVPRGALDSH